MIPVAQPIVGDVEVEAVQRVLRSGQLTQGTEVAHFESAFAAAAVADRECVAVNSGTSALHLSLLAAGIGPGDEVVVPSFTFAATANAVAMTGATVVFCDIEPDYFCMDPRMAEHLITPRTRAIIPVHLYGHPAAMPELSYLCDANGIALIEDAAQAHLATLDGVPVGAWGLAGCFSFYPTKNMTSGEGGMVSTGLRTFARQVRLLRNQGQEQKYRNEVIGLNNRMTDIHAAIGLSQLGRLPEWTSTRRTNAAYFSHHLHGVVTPLEAPGAVHVYHQYTIRVPGHDRNRFADELRKRGIDSGVYYPVPVHELPAYSRPEALLHTQLASSECLSLPVHPSLTASQLEQVVIAVNQVAQAGA